MRFLLCIESAIGWDHHEVNIAVPEAIQTADQLERYGYVSDSNGAIKKFWRGVVEDLKTRFDLEGKTHILREIP